jgi:plastocyanin
MDWGKARSRVSAAVMVGGCLATIACGGAPVPNATAAPDAPPSASPTAGPSKAPTPASTPAAVPLATFEVSVEPATEAPADAIAIELHIEGTTPLYNPNLITAPPGTIVLFLSNTDPVRERHDFHLGPDVGQVQARMASIGGRTSVILRISDVPAGRYAFWCSIQDHYKFGMVGTLTVTP